MAEDDLRDISGSSKAAGFHVPEVKVKFTKLFINGEFVSSLSGKEFETIDPRTGDTVAHVAQGDKEDVDALSRLLVKPSTMVPGLDFLAM